MVNATFNSHIFGKTRVGSNEEQAQISKAVAEMPVTVFHEISKKLNERGFLIEITRKEK